MLVHMSGIHCYMHASSTSGCAFLSTLMYSHYCTKVVEYLLFLSPGCTKASVKAAVMPWSLRRPADTKGSKSENNLESGARFIGYKPIQPRTVLYSQ